MAVTAAPLPPASNSLPSLLETLTSSLTACAAASNPSTTIFDPSSSIVTKDGISLLTAKNEILVSYLQNLVFLIVLKLRSLRGGEEDGGDLDLGKDVVQKLEELRVYMEKGVRPLEGKLKYQIEKVVKAAEEAERRKGKDVRNGSTAGKGKKKDRVKVNGDVSTEEEDDSNSATDNDEEDYEEDDEQELDDLSYRPNPSALLKNPTTAEKPNPSSSTSDQAYRPPRINPVSMPHDPSTSSFDSRSRRDRPPPKSALIDDYISSELSSAPQSQPSIGSSLATGFPSARGHQASQRERKDELERRRYEEENFVRLPGPSKKERKKSAARERGRGGDRMGYGGEEFAGLGEMGERVSRAVGRRDGARSEGALGRSRKRSAMERDGGHGELGGKRMGEGFEKRRRILEERKRRKGRTDG